MLQSGPVRVRVRQYIWAKVAEAFPHEPFAQVCALGSSKITDNDHAPFAVPIGGGLEVDALSRFVEFPFALPSQSVVAAPPDGFVGENTVLHEAINGGSHQPVLNIQCLESANQTAQPDTAAAWCDAVAEHGYDERAGAYGFTVFKGAFELRHLAEQFDGHGVGRYDTQSKLWF